MHLAFEGFIALRYLRARRKQTFLSLISLLTMLGFCVGVAAMIIALGLMNGFQDDVRRAIVGNNAQLTVFTARRGAGDIAIPAESLAAVRSVEGVVEATRVIVGQGVLASQGAYQFTEVLGVDPGPAGRVFGFDRVEGRDGAHEGAGEPFVDLAPPDPSRREPILLGRELAADLEVLPGDVVRLLTADVRLAPWGPMPKPHYFEVAGIVHAGFDTYDQTRSYVRLEAARRLFGSPEGALRVSVRVAERASVAAVRRSLEEALGPEFAVVDIMELNPGFFSALRLEKVLLLVALGLIVAVAGLGMFTTLILMVMEKVRDIGALVALGTTPARITRIFLLQGMVVGVLGTLLGALLGTTACWTMTRWKLIALDPTVYYIDHLAFLVRPGDVVGVVLAALAVSLGATLYPSWRAASLDPVRALHYE